MPSRQERRKAERDAAKRAPARAGAARAAEAAAALAGVSLNPGGDWTTQSEDPMLLAHALGAEALQQKAAEGHREVHWSLGFLLVIEAEGAPGARMGTAGRSPKADVGFARCTAQFPLAHMTEIRPCGHLPEQ
jgi:hypothetical protein